MVEGVRLGAHRVAVPVDLVEQVGRFVQAVVTDVHVLLFYILGPPCEGRDTQCFMLGFGSSAEIKVQVKVSSLVLQHCGNNLDLFVLFLMEYSLSFKYFLLKGNLSS